MATGMIKMLVPALEGLVSLSFWSSAFASYESQSEYAEAEPLFKQALEILSEALGSAHTNTQTVAGNFALFLRERGRVSEAQAIEVEYKLD